MSGFETWPLDFVERLQEILRDQYTSRSFYSIAKELLQNADDAGAEVLRFGLRPGWGEDVHPLLNGDVLLALNDGVFTAEDARAIRHFGVGSKREDAAAIGRYGLGLKSAFHWCEGFFFAASSNPEAKGGGAKVELLSPWLGGPSDQRDEARASWDNCGRAYGELADFVARWAADLRRWFCIVIPLRNAAHVFDGVSIQPPPFPTSEQLSLEMDVWEVGRAAPLLRSVTAIETWVWRTKHHAFALEERCGIDRSERETPGGDVVDRVSGARGVSGHVVSDSRHDSSSDGAKRAQFAGLCLRVEDPEFAALKDRPEWPRSPSHTGQFVTDKVEPDCAALAIVSRARDAMLAIRPAVFLPLSTPLEEKKLNSSFAVEVLLHGQFFVDGGRKHLLSEDNRPDDIRLTWNRRLMQRGVLPLLLPALHRCVVRARLDDTELRELTETLRNMSWVQQNLAAICKDYHWVYRRQWAPEASGAWSLVPREMPVLRLPVIEGLPWSELASALPYVRELGESACLTGVDDPFISHTGPTDWADAADDARQLIGSASAASLARAEVLEFLGSFLRQMRSIPETVLVEVIRLVREHLAQHRNERTDRWRGEFRGLLKSVGPERWIKLGRVEQDALRIIHALNTLPIERIVVPDNLAHDDRGGTFSGAECRVVFEDLAERGRNSPSQQNLAAAVALRVLEASDRRDETLRPAVADIPVFTARTARDRAQNRQMTWNELRQYHSASRLFATGSTDLPLLQDAIDTELLSLYAPTECEPFRILFDSAPHRCTPAACIKLLMDAPPLRASAHRVALFRRLLATTEGVEDTKQRKALRYLLHGHADKLNELDSPLLVGASFKKKDPISHVADETLRRAGDGWRVVPDALCRQATEDQWEALGVCRVDGRSLTEILRLAATTPTSLSWIASLGLTAAEAEEVLLALVDPAVRRLVPLHRLFGDREDEPASYVALSSQECFLAPGDGVVHAPDVAALITLLHRPADPRLLQTYHAEGIETWGPLPSLRVALGDSTPHLYAEDILQALEAQQGAVPPDVLERLRDVPWLPARSGSVAPRYVVDLDALADELQRLLDDPAIGNVFACVSTIDVDWHTQSHGLAEMRKRRVLPAFDESIELLATCLGELEAYRLGDIRELQDDPIALRDVVRAFQECGDLPPVVALLDSLFDKYPKRHEEIAAHVSHGILSQGPVSSLRNCVELLTEKAASRRLKRGSIEHHVLGWFLRAFAQHPQFGVADLAGLRLLARDGTWHTVNELCFEAEGVGDEFLLDPDLRDAFPEAIRRFRAHDGDTSATTEQSDEVSEGVPSDAIVEYFERWRGWVPRPSVGGFLALLGDEDALASEAEDSLRPRSIRDVREQINWEPIVGSVAVGADEDIHTMMSKQRFRVCFGRDGEPIPVRNLLGEKFEARVGGESNSLFLGSLFFAPSHGRCKVITLREIDPSRFSPQRLNEFLLESSRMLLRDVYFRQSARIDELWEQLGEATQLQIEIVQDVILESAWIVLEQLGLRSMNAIRELARRRDELERRRAEARYSTEPREVREEVERELVALNAELRALIETDADVQREMLAAVREKMERHYQYSLASLPFELLQNADDAAAELGDMVNDFRGDPATRLVQVALQADGAEAGAFTFMHWGRPINEFHRGQFSAQDGRRRGYDTDLRKMLLLAASDKRERDSIVTGKFGLGFKTVYFASDRPQVLSGDLGFEVIGGLLPGKLKTGAIEQLKAIMRASQGGRRDGTVVQLPLTCDMSAMHHALEAFVTQLPFMLAFSRHVNACQVSINGAATRIEWAEQPITGGTVFAGRACVQGEHDALECERALVFRDGPCALLLAIRPEGVFHLDSSVPVFWVSAPTRTYSRAGVAVNGTFRVDVGRTQLACERDGQPLRENVQVAKRLGESVGQGLIELFDAIASNWEELRAQLGLLHDLTGADFWNSVLDVLVRAGQDANMLLSEIIWGSERGLTRVLTQREALPTALPGAFAGFTHPSAVRAAVEGILDTEEDVFKSVAAWPQFCQKYGRGALVSRSRVLDDVRDAEVMDASRPGRITLESAIRLETQEPGVSADVASRLGAVVTRRALRAWESREGQSRANEVDGLRSVLRELRFRARSGDWVISSDLLVPDPVTGDVPRDGSDESCRASFAPPDRVLHDEYSGAAAEFVLTCRGTLNAPAELLAQWILRAESESRPAALRYLLEGELARQVGDIVRARRDGTWIAELAFAELSAMGFEEGEQTRLLPMTGVTRSALGNMCLEISPEFPRPRVHAEPGVLRTIYEWWKENASRELITYDAMIYPDGQFPIQDRDVEQVDRLGWLRLFMLACTRSMGRSTDEQHRDFLRLCDERKWIERMIDLRNEPNAWLACWSEYADGQVDQFQYYHWMKNLLGLSIVARHLDEYIDAFLAIDRFNREFALDEVTSPRSSAAFSGGGPDAPPIGAILGIGQCFLLRELVRHRIVASPFAHRWCYLPHRRARNLIERVGGPSWTGFERLYVFSTEIHAFLSWHLDDPTFDQSFDIPLTIVADDNDLWEKLVDQDPPDEEHAEEDTRQ